MADFLSELHLPDEFEETAANAIGELLGQENLGERIEQIKGIIECLDFRWDMGFIQEDEYIKRREELKAELAQRQPIPRDELIEARKLLKDFKRLWSEGDQEARQRLLSLILERVWVQDDFPLGLLIRPKYLIWVREGMSDRAGAKVEPAQLPPFLAQQKKENGHLRMHASDHLRERRASVAQRQLFERDFDCPSCRALGIASGLWRSASVQEGSPSRVGYIYVLS